MIKCLVWVRLIKLHDQVADLDLLAFDCARQGFAFEVEDHLF